MRPELLQPPLNVVRLSLHPQGLANRTLNAAEWRGHMLDRLRRQVELTADPALIDLLAEVRAYPTPTNSDRRSEDFGGVAVPLQLMLGDQVLSFLSATTVFGTAVDITLSELTLETFFPADAATAGLLRQLHAGLD